jgi:heme/copper-type cytochrome/quinol oxidase subunit 1
MPKITGRLVGDGAAKVALIAILVGLYAFALMSFFAGVKGQPADVYKFYGGEGLDGFNLVASIGAFVMAAGVLLELGNLAYSYSRGVVTGHDPWGAGTLEWFATSPPPIHNFDVVPDVRSSEPLYDIRRAISDRTHTWRPPTREPGPAHPERERVAGESGGAEPATR